MAKKAAGKKKIKTALFLDPEQIEVLEKLQKRFPGIAMSEHIRRAIRLYGREMDRVKQQALPGAE